MEENIKKIMAERIELLLIKNGISQTNFGVLIGKTQPVISDWINRKRNISIVDYINIFEKIRWRYSIKPEDWYQFESNAFLSMRKNPWQK